MSRRNREKHSPIHTNDWAILYLRIIIGGALLLHNVAKMQDYNTIINSYNELWGVGGTTWYMIFSTIEVVAAFMLIIGRWVRLAASVLILGTISVMILYFRVNYPIFIELQSLYILIYLLFVITGGGYYSMDMAYSRAAQRAINDSNRVVDHP